MNRSLSFARIWQYDVAKIREVLVLNAKKTGELLVSLRREKGMNQKELADKLEVTNKAVSRWETGGFPQLRKQWAESILVIHCLRI